MSQPHNGRNKDDFNEQLTENASVQNDNTTDSVQGIDFTTRMARNLLAPMTEKFTSIPNDEQIIIYKTTLPYSETSVRFAYTSPLCVTQITTKGCTFEPSNITPSDHDLGSQVVGQVTFHKDFTSNHDGFSAPDRHIAVWVNKRSYFTYTLHEQIVIFQRYIEKF